MNNYRRGISDARASSRRRWHSIVGADAPLMHEWSKDQADKVIDEVRAAYKKLYASLGSTWTDSNEQSQLRHAIEFLGSTIEKWATTYRKWAEQGHTDDGKTYSWGRWATFGKSLVSDIKSHGSYFSDSQWVSNALDDVEKKFQAAAEKAAKGFELGLGDLGWGLGIVLGLGILWKLR